MAIVYLLTNLENGKKYVGKTKSSVDSRWYEHVRSASDGSRYAIHRAIRKYGKDAFTRAVLGEYPTEEEALAAEKDWIEKLGTRDPERGYNMVDGGRGAVGFKHSDEEKARRSARAKASWQDPEFRARCTASGAATLTSPDVRAKIAATKGSEEWRASQSKRTREFQARPEVKAKMVAAVRERLSDPEARQRSAEHLADVRKRWTEATHCSKGHEFTEANTYRPKGKKNVRICRQCTNDYARSRRVPRPRAPATHCKRGHEFTPENTIKTKRSRTCRACGLERRQADYQAARDAGLSVAEARARR